MAFGGMPLIAWSIRFAQRSNCFDGIYVSTDDAAIAAVAKDYGAEVIHRPAQLSNDTATTAAAAAHAFDYISGFKTCHWLCTLQPTNPLRPEMLMNAAINVLPKLDVENESLMTVTELPFKVGRRSPNGVFSAVGYQLGQRSQDIQKLYHENGLLYVTSAEMLAQGRFFGERVLTIETDRCFDVDIDTLLDFRIAETLLNEDLGKFSYLS